MTRGALVIGGALALLAAGILVAAWRHSKRARARRLSADAAARDRLRRYADRYTAELHARARRAAHVPRGTKRGGP